MKGEARHKEDMVFVHPFGRCYHRKDCVTMYAGGHAPIWMTKVKALFEGYRACRRCRKRYV